MERNGRGVFSRDRASETVKGSDQWELWALEQACVGVGNGEIK